VLTGPGEPWPTVRRWDGTLMPLFSQATTGHRRVACPGEPALWRQDVSEHPVDALGTLPNRAARQAQSTRRMSTRKVDDLVRMLAADSGMSKSEVSRICADLDAEVGTFRDPQEY
jgi:hypothetical protein